MERGRIAMRRIMLRILMKDERNERSEPNELSGIIISLVLVPTISIIITMRRRDKLASCRGETPRSPPYSAALGFRRVRPSAGFAGFGVKASEPLLSLPLAHLGLGFLESF